MIAAYDDSNTFYVGPGGTYDTIAEGVAAAEAVASADNPVVVKITGIHTITEIINWPDYCVGIGERGSSVITGTCHLVNPGSHGGLYGLTLLNTAAHNSTASCIYVEQAITDFEVANCDVLGGTWTCTQKDAATTATNLCIRDCYVTGHNPIFFYNTAKLRVLRNTFREDGVAGGVCNSFVDISPANNFNALIDGNDYEQITPSGVPAFYYGITLGGYGHQYSNNKLRLVTYATLDDEGPDELSFIHQSADYSVNTVEQAPIRIVDNTFVLECRGGATVRYWRGLHREGGCNIELGRNTFVMPGAPSVTAGYSLVTVATPSKVTVFPGGFGGIEHLPTDITAGTEIELCTQPKTLQFDAASLAPEASKSFLGGGTSGKGFQPAQPLFIDRMTLVGTGSAEASDGTLTGRVYNGTTEKASVAITGKNAVLDARNTAWNEPVSVLGDVSADWGVSDGAVSYPTDVVVVGTRSIKWAQASTTSATAAVFALRTDDIHTAGYTRARVWLRCSIALAEGDLKIGFTDSAQENAYTVNGPAMTIPNTWTLFDFALTNDMKAMEDACLYVNNTLVGSGAVNTWIDGAEVYVEPIVKPLIQPTEFMSAKIDVGAGASTPTWTDVSLIVEAKGLS